MRCLGGGAELRGKAKRFRRMAKGKTNERIARMLVKHAMYLDRVAAHLDHEQQAPDQPLGQSPQKNKAIEPS